MRIAVYSGSFNPMHIGHLAILEHLSTDPSFDATYLVVTPTSPFKEAGAGNGGSGLEAAGTSRSGPEAAGTGAGNDGAGLDVMVGDGSVADNGRVRLEEARRVVDCRPELRARVDDIEFGMEGPWYTIRTLKALREREPSNTFTLVFGADHLGLIRGWKDYQSILLDFGIVVFPRRGDDCRSLREDLLKENPAYRIRIADAPLVDVSSTFIRAAISRGEDVSSVKL